MIDQENKEMHIQEKHGEDGICVGFTGHNMDPEGADSINREDGEDHMPSRCGKLMHLEQEENISHVLKQQLPSLSAFTSPGMPTEV
jgi:hypothetical protein